MAWEKELATAQRAVLCAARLTKRVQSSVTGLAKADSSPVTVADFAAQAVLTRMLRSAFPADAFVGEEDAAALRADGRLCGRVLGLYRGVVAEEEGEEEAKTASEEEMLALIDLGGRGRGGRQGRFWTMDPVDGTASFLRGGQYAVAVALVQHGREVVGAAAYPNLLLRGGRVAEEAVDEAPGSLGWMLSGAEGEGVTATRVFGARRREEEELPRLVAGPRPHLVGWAVRDDEVLVAMGRALGVVAEGDDDAVTEVWSAHVRYAALVLGGADLLVRLVRPGGSPSCIWDHAGAQLIVRELGGCVSDLDGRDIDFGAGRYLVRNRGLVVARGAALHADALRALKEAASLSLGPTP